MTYQKSYDLQCLSYEFNTRIEVVEAYSCFYDRRSSYSTHQTMAAQVQP